MSLLDNPAPPANAAFLLKIKRLKSGPRELFNMLYGGWARSMSAIWDSPDIPAVLAELGTDAAEMFLLSQKTVAFLEDLKPGCTAATLAKMQPFTIHPDGTITLDS